MMTCAVDSYPPSALATAAATYSYYPACYHHSATTEEHAFLKLAEGEAGRDCSCCSWLQTEIYHDYVLPAGGVGAPACSNNPPGLGLYSRSNSNSYTPDMAPVLFSRPQNKPLAVSSSNSSALYGVAGRGYRSSLRSAKSTGPKAPAWWETELAVSIHNTLRKREESAAKIYFKSPQLHLRGQLVNFLFTVCRELEVSTGTRHLAMRLVDQFMDGHNVMEYRLKLMALTCLLLAAKSEEQDDNVPSIEMLQHAARMNDYSSASSYSRQEFHTLELYILKYFNWCMSHPSVAHFIDYYVHVSLTEDSETASMSNWEKSVLENQTKYFMEVTLREEKFLSFKPSEVAAAIVCVGRIYTGMRNVWSSSLQEASSYSLSSLQPVASLILSLNEQQH